jgi:apolipoprotein N-acyltransferase
MTTRTTQIAVALLVLIPLTLWIASRIGETVPFVLGIVAAAILAVAVPPRDLTWEVIAIPLGLAAVVGEVRDHRRRGRR